MDLCHITNSINRPISLAVLRSVFR